MVQKPEKYTEQFNFLDEKLLIVLNSKECKLWLCLHTSWYRCSQSPRHSASCLL